MLRHGNLERRLRRRHTIASMFRASPVARAHRRRGDRAGPGPWASEPTIAFVATGSRFCGNAGADRCPSGQRALAELRTTRMDLCPGLESPLAGFLVLVADEPDALDGCLACSPTG